MHTSFGAGFVEEIEKLGYAESPCSTMKSEESWSDRFQGTPFYEQALALEEQDIQTDLQFQERRLQEDQERLQKGDLWREEDLARTQMRLEKRKLELVLAQSKHQTESKAKGEGWQDLDAAGMKPPQGAPAPQAAPAPQPQGTPAK